MTLYHGSNVEVNDPKLIPTKRLLDFGAGFYLTSDFEQAKKWALRTTSNRKIGTPLVSVYEVDDEMAEKVRVLIFEATNSGSDILQQIELVNCWMKNMIL